MKFVRLVVPFALCALTLTPQTTDPVIRVDVDLRQVDLVVTDKQGHHITDLKPEEFQIFEDGKPQKITNFSWIEVSPPPTGARLTALQKPVSLMEKFSGVAHIAKTPGNDINSAPVTNPHKDEIRRTLAFVINAHVGPVIDRVRKLIDEQLAPGDMVSIRSTARSIAPLPHGRQEIRDSMGIFQQFTNDKRQLDAALYRVLRTCDYIHTCITDVPGALAAAIQSLRAVPGRKAVVFVGGYPGPVGRLIDLANRAGVVVNVLNPAGTPMNPMVEGFPGAESIVQLAKQTGGSWLLSTPGASLTTDLNEVMEDLSGYYLLGFHPEHTDDGVRHKIEVKVLRTGLIVRARNGVMGSPVPTATPVAVPKGREEVITQALFSLFTADGIRLHLDPVFAASPADPKTKKRSPVVRTRLDIDGRDLTLTDVDSANKKIVLDLALAVFNEDGSQAGAKNMSFTIKMAKEKAARIAATGFQYAMDVPLAGPGPYQVRVAVRDQASGELGSAYSFLDIPDVNKQKLSLSSLVLSLSDGPAARTSWNEFRQGSTIGFTCEAFGLKGRPDVDMEIRLYRGEGPVVDIPPTAAKMENTGGRWFLTGSVQIPRDLAEGNYAMEVIAYDRMVATKRQVVEQWADLTVK